MKWVRISLVAMLVLTFSVIPAMAQQPDGSHASGSVQTFFSQSFGDGKNGVSVASDGSAAYDAKTFNGSKAYGSADSTSAGNGGVVFNSTVNPTGVSANGLSTSKDSAFAHGQQLNVTVKGDAAQENWISTGGTNSQVSGDNLTQSNFSGTKTSGVPPNATAVGPTPFPPTRGIALQGNAVAGGTTTGSTGDGWAKGTLDGYASSTVKTVGPNATGSEPAQLTGGASGDGKLGALTFNGPADNPTSAAVAIGGTDFSVTGANTSGAQHIAVNTSVTPTSSTAHTDSWASTTKTASPPGPPVPASTSH